MATVEVFDPAMCCSTGVCGTDVDPTLSQFAADLDWLTAAGVTVERATLSAEPAKFVASDVVSQLLIAQGVAALPAIVVDGSLRSSGRYPSRAELADWAAQPGSSVDVAPAPAHSALPMAGGCCGGSSCC
jgi:hypothetical protein